MRYRSGSSNVVCVVTYCIVNVGKLAWLLRLTLFLINATEEVGVDPILQSLLLRFIILTQPDSPNGRDLPVNLYRFRKNFGFKIVRTLWTTTFQHVTIKQRFFPFFNCLLPLWKQCSNDLIWKKVFSYRSNSNQIWESWKLLDLGLVLIQLCLTNVICMFYFVWTLVVLHWILTWSQNSM